MENKTVAPPPEQLRAQDNRSADPGSAYSRTWRPRVPHAGPERITTAGGDKGSVCPTILAAAVVVTEQFATSLAVIAAASVRYSTTSRFPPGVATDAPQSARAVEQSTLA